MTRAQQFYQISNSSYFFSLLTLHTIHYIMRYSYVYININVTSVLRRWHSVVSGMISSLSHINENSYSPHAGDATRRRRQGNIRCLFSSFISQHRCYLLALRRHVCLTYTESVQRLEHAQITVIYHLSQRSRRINSQW